MDREILRGSFSLTVPFLHTALELGLANRLVPKGEVLNEGLKLAHRLAALPAQALQDTKRALNLHFERAFSGVLEFAISAETEAMNSADHLEQVRKFLEREPR